MSRRSTARARPVTGGQRTFYLVLAAIVVVGVVTLGSALRGGAGTAATEPVALEVADARALYERAMPIRLGQPGAPIRIVLFDDLQCPACAAFARTQRPRLMPWVEEGTAQLIFYDFPIGGSLVHGFLAARAARCAGAQPLAGSPDGSGYWPYRDLLYGEQGSWSPRRSVTDEFIGYARDIGLDGRGFERCLLGDRFADVVTANRMIGDHLGVRGTPTGWSTTGASRGAPSAPSGMKSSVS